MSSRWPVRRRAAGSAAAICSRRGRSGPLPHHDDAGPREPATEGAGRLRENPRRLVVNQCPDESHQRARLPAEPFAPELLPVSPRDATAVYTAMHQVDAVRRHAAGHEHIPDRGRDGNEVLPRGGVLGPRAGLHGKIHPARRDDGDLPEERLHGERVGVAGVGMDDVRAELRGEGPETAHEQGAARTEQPGLVVPGDGEAIGGHAAGERGLREGKEMLLVGALTEPQGEELHLPLAPAKARFGVQMENPHCPSRR